MAVQDTRSVGYTGSGPPPPGSGIGAGRVVAIIAAVLAFLLAFGLGAAAIAVALVSGARDSDGYLGTGSHRLVTPTAALVSDSVDLQVDPGPDWVYSGDRLGTVRIRTTGAAGAEVFVGVAAASDVDGWLDGAAHDTVRDVSLSPFRVRYVRAPGEATDVSPPADEDFWVASTQGSGQQTLTWRPTDGRWVLVIANADGRAGVDVSASVAARVPALGWLAVGLLVGTVVVVVIAVVLLVVGLSGRKQAPVPAPRQGG